MTMKLVKTCGACPEQYDAFLGGRKVGYLRLRHGHFRAECFGDVVYEADTKGDGLFDDDERDHHLRQAVRAIKDQLNKRGGKTEYEIVER